jgi:hypothetical protein
LNHLVRTDRLDDDVDADAVGPLTETIAASPEIVPLTSYEVNDTFVGRTATGADLPGRLQKRNRRACRIFISLA